MSAKSKLLFQASPTETLVTASRLAAIQRAQGNIMLFAATCPGRPIDGTKSWTLEIDGLRTPFVFFRFHFESAASANASYTHYFRFSEGPTTLLYEKVLAKGVVYDHVHVHRVAYGTGSTTEFLQVQNPTTLTISTKADGYNGTATATNFFKNITVGGFSGYDKAAPGENIPFRIKQAGIYTESYSYSEWPSP